MASEMRTWGNDFVADMPAAKSYGRVLEIGYPAQPVWADRAVTVDFTQGDDKTIRGYFEDTDIEGPFDLVASVWALSYCKDPHKVLTKAIDLLPPGGHLLIITRTADHVKDDWNIMKWVPTPNHLENLPDFYPISAIMTEESHDCFAGLWRKI